ncbi:MAG: L,D-transpeptidase family protein [Acidimicrobiia bacterium]
MSFIVGLLTIAMMASAPVDGPAMERTPPASIAYGDDGIWVGALNRRLADAGFHPDVGNEFGRRTRHAVYALQKHHGLETTGRITEDMWDLLDVPIRLPVRAERNRVEVDLAKQVLYLVEEGSVTLVLPISSGSGEAYRNGRGGISRARTPEGKYTFDWKVNGVRRSYLGTLYNPYYFHSAGYAIHGSPSVPNFPASHGCIRLTYWDMDLIKTKIELGWSIYVYGQRTPPPAPYAVPFPPPVAL